MRFWPRNKWRLRSEELEAEQAGLAEVKDTLVSEANETRLRLERELAELKRSHDISQAHLEGRFSMATERINQLERISDFVLLHEWTIGGRQVVHNLEPLTQFECVCGATLFAPDGLFKI